MHIDTPNAALVEEVGAGRSLSQDSDVETIRAAARDLLETPSYAAIAREFAKQFGGVDGALGAAFEIEAVLARQAGAAKTRRAAG